MGTNQYLLNSMKSKKLLELIKKVEAASDQENRDFISLNDELAIKVYGGTENATNTGCTNTSCTAGSNSTCTNYGCTTGTSNTGCDNLPIQQID